MLHLLSMQHQQHQHQHQQQHFTKVSISILVMSLPLLYVSLLHIPPSTLFKDTTFWFLMSNSIIIVIAADSGMLFFSSSSSTTTASDDLSYASGEPFAVKNNHTLAVMPVVVAADEPVVAKNHALVVKGQEEPMATKDVHAVVESRPKPKPKIEASKSLAKERPSSVHPHGVHEKSIVVRREEKLRRSVTEGARQEESEYARLSDEELNRRVEEFITRFNREIRLQVEKEGV